MTEGFKDKVAKTVTVALIVVIGVGGAVSVWPTYLRGKELKRQDAELTQRIEEKKREIAKLIENQNRFRSDRDFVEQIARRNGRVFGPASARATVGASVPSLSHTDMTEQRPRRSFGLTESAAARISFANARRASPFTFIQTSRQRLRPPDNTRLPNSSGETSSPNSLE